MHTKYLIHLVFIIYYILVYIFIYIFSIYLFSIYYRILFCIVNLIVHTICSGPQAVVLLQPQGTPKIFHGGKPRNNLLGAKCLGTLVISKVVYS